MSKYGIQALFVTMKVSLKKKRKKKKLSAELQYIVSNLVKQAQNTE